jgi:hypothetical protein
LWKTLEEQMADRKQFLSSSEPDGDLLELLSESEKTEVTEDMLHEQRVSFAFGNAMNADGITKDSVRNSSKSIRLRA